MSRPVAIDIPHSQGKAAARQKLENGFDKLAGFVPGGRVTEHRWNGDQLFFAVEALGQRVGATVEVMEDKVHAELDLPPAMALFASRITETLKGAGAKLLK